MESRVESFEKMMHQIAPAVLDQWRPNSESLKVELAKPLDQIQSILESYHPNPEYFALLKEKSTLMKRVNPFKKVMRDCLHVALSFQYEDGSLIKSAALMMAELKDIASDIG